MLLLLINLRFRLRIMLCLSLLAGLIVGTFRMSLLNADIDYVHELCGQTVVVSGQITEDPDIDDGQVSLKISNLVFGNQVAVSGIIYARINTTQTLNRSDTLILEGVLSPGFGSFVATMWQPKLLELHLPNPPDLALQLRNAFSSQVKQVISNPEADLALGYLLGQKSTLPSDLSMALQTVGLTHIVVASGYNLSVLVRISRRIFEKISRFAASFFGFLLIFCFIAVTGLSPSMFRAGLVAILSLFFWYFGRRFHPAKLLIIAIAITLLCNPSYLLDLGWLLSFASFAGIMLLSPILTDYFYGPKTPNFVAATLIETVSAQICCLPILLFSFGSFSILSILANILILPTIPFVMLLTFLTGCCFFFKIVSMVFAYFTQLLLSYHLAVIDFFVNIKWALFSTSANNPICFILYLPLLIAAFLLWRNTKYKFSTQLRERAKTPLRKYDII